jgi:hypothetical protein
MPFKLTKEFLDSSAELINRVEAHDAFRMMRVAVFTVIPEEQQALLALGDL